MAFSNPINYVASTPGSGSLTVPLTSLPKAGQLLICNLWMDNTGSNSTTDPVWTPFSVDNLSNVDAFVPLQTRHGSPALAINYGSTNQFAFFTQSFFHICKGNELVVTINCGNTHAASTWGCMISEFDGFNGKPVPDIVFDPSSQAASLIQNTGVANQTVQHELSIAAMITNVAGSSTFAPLVASGCIYGDISGAVGGSTVQYNLATSVQNVNLGWVEVTSELMGTAVGANDGSQMQWTGALGPTTFPVVLVGYTFFDDPSNTAPFTNPQSIQGTFNSGTSVVATWNTAPKAGQLITASIRIEATASSTATWSVPTDTAGGTWIAHPNNATGSAGNSPAFVNSAFWYRVVGANESWGALQVTLHWSGVTPTNGSCFEIDEWDGFLGTPTADLNSSHSTSTGTVTTIAAPAGPGNAGLMDRPVELSLCPMALNLTTQVTFTTNGCFFNGAHGGSTLFTLNTQTNNLVVGWCAGTDGNGAVVNSNWNMQWNNSSAAIQYGISFFDSPFSNPHTYEASVAGANTSVVVSITTPPRGQLFVVWLYALMASGTPTWTFTGQTWNSIIARQTVLSGGTNLYMQGFYYISQSTETSVTINISTTGGNTWYYQLEEYDGFTGTPTLDTTLGSHAASNASGTTTAATNTTNQQIQAIELAVASTVFFGGSGPGTITASGCWYGLSTGIKRLFTTHLLLSNIMIDGWTSSFSSQSTNQWNFNWTVNFNAVIVIGANFRDVLPPAPWQTRKPPIASAYTSAKRVNKSQASFPLIATPPVPYTWPVGSPPRHGMIAIPHDRHQQEIPPSVVKVAALVPQQPPQRRGKVLTHARLQVEQPVKTPTTIQAIAIGSPSRHGKVVPHTLLQQENQPAAIVTQPALAVGSPPRRPKVLPHTRLPVEQRPQVPVILALVSVSSPPRRGKVLPHILLQQEIPPEAVTVSGKLAIGSPPRRGKVIKPALLESGYMPSKVQAPMVPPSPVRVRRAQRKAYGIHPQVAEIFKTAPSIVSIAALTQPARRGKVIPHLHLPTPILPISITPPAAVLLTPSTIGRRRLVLLRTFPRPISFNTYTIVYPPTHVPIGGDVLFIAFSNITGWVAYSESAGWTAWPNVIGWYNDQGKDIN